MIIQGANKKSFREDNFVIVLSMSEDLNAVVVGPTFMLRQHTCDRQGPVCLCPSVRNSRGAPQQLCWCPSGPSKKKTRGATTVVGPAMAAAAGERRCARPDPTATNPPLPAPKQLYQAVEWVLLSRPTPTPKIHSYYSDVQTQLGEATKISVSRTVVVIHT